MDLGLEAAGFRIFACIERDVDAQQTITANRPNWRLLQPGDIHAHAPETVLTQAMLSRGNAALLAAGPPCQPFSKAAYWIKGDTHRLADPRSRTLMACLGVVEAALPQVLLLENVNGLSYRGKSEALDFLLEGIERINHRSGTRYVPCVFRLDSADFGVPQIRERTYLVADRDGRTFTPPSPTHGPGARNGTLEPHMTAWDAIGDLDMPDWDESLRPRGKWADLLSSIPEGHNYLWHTNRSSGWPLFGWRTRFWSFLLKLSKNRPSWTISAHPGPSTGPFHWRNRSLSTRELCRLQTFPDGFRVYGSQISARRQLGNAVPPLIAEVLGREIGAQLLHAAPSGMLRFRLHRRQDCPPSEPVTSVPPKYWCLAGDHPAHPGVGKGPRASKRISSGALGGSSNDRTAV